MLVVDRIEQPLERRLTLRLGLVCVALGLLAWPLFASGHLVLRLVVIAQFACFAVPFWHRWVQGELDYFEPIHVLNLLGFVFFGLGSLWVVDDPARYSFDTHLGEYVPRAAAYCLLGQVAMLIGYFGPWHSKAAPQRPIEWPRGATLLLILTGLGFVGQIASILLEQSAHTGSKLLVGVSPIAQFSPMLLYVWSLGWLLFYTGRMTRSQRWMLFAVTTPAVAMIAFFTVSDKSLVMTFIGLPIIARWYGIRRIPWLLLITLLLLLVFVVFPVYNTFRWQDPHLATGQRLQLTYGSLQTRGTEGYLRFSVDSFKYRLALITSVAVVVRDVPRWVPYAQGSTIFDQALTLFIPRYLWPDKPVASFGRDFGRMFRVTNYFSRNSYVAPTIPGELYWNFSVLGILGGMGLLGHFVRALYRWFGQNGARDPVRCAVHLLILEQLAHAGAIAAPAVTLIRLLIMLAVLRWLARYFGMLDGQSPDAA